MVRFPRAARMRRRGGAHRRTASTDATDVKDTAKAEAGHVVDTAKQEAGARGRRGEVAGEGAVRADAARAARSGRQAAAACRRWSALGGRRAARAGIGHRRTQSRARDGPRAAGVHPGERRRRVARRPGSRVAARGGQVLRAPQARQCSSASRCSQASWPVGSPGHWPRAAPTASPTWRTGSSADRNGHRGPDGARHTRTGVDVDDWARNGSQTGNADVRPGADACSPPRPAVCR